MKSCQSCLILGSALFCSSLGPGQNHLAVAGGYAVGSIPKAAHAPTRYREVVLTRSKRTQRLHREMQNRALPTISFRHETEINSVDLSRVPAEPGNICSTCLLPSPATTPEKHSIRS